MTSPKDIALAVKAKRYGAKYSLRIILEARKVGLPISLAFALVEKESGFTNVFGHDPGNHSGAGAVTKSKYLAYKAQRGSTGRGGMQGVGPCQLTYYSYQDTADRLGGCWKPRYNIQVGLGLLANHIRQYGKTAGIAAYNGSGPAAQAYARSVEQIATKWHNRLK